MSVVTRQRSAPPTSSDRRHGADGRLAEGGSAGIRPGDFPCQQFPAGGRLARGRSRLGDSMPTAPHPPHPPRRQANAGPRGALLSSDDLRIESRASGEASSVMAWLAHVGLAVDEVMAGALRAGLSLRRAVWVRLVAAVAGSGAWGTVGASRREPALDGTVVSRQRGGDVMATVLAALIGAYCGSIGTAAVQEWLRARRERREHRETLIQPLPVPPPRLGCTRVLRRRSGYPIDEPQTCTTRKGYVKVLGIG